MSYEKVSALSIDMATGEVSLTTACSSLSPQVHERWSFKAEEHGLAPADAAIAAVMKNVAGGNFQLQRSVSVNVRYAVQRAFESAKKYHGTLISEYRFGLYELLSKRDMTDEELMVRRTLINVYKEAYHEEDRKGRHILKMNHYYVKKPTPSGCFITGSPSDAKDFQRFKRAYLEKCALGFSGPVEIITE